jgi:ribose 5-phosphate isomerase A
MDPQALKELAGKKAAEELVKSGMKLGLGTGSTAIHVIRRLGVLLQEGTLRDILAFPTSFQSTIECEKLNIPVFSLNSRELGGHLDLTIDGADEIDTENRCVKGGGGALLMEKIAAYASASYALVADESKSVENLGLKFPVPVEVIPEARITVTGSLEKLGAQVTLREAVRKAGPVITEHGNLLLDIRFSAPVDPVFLENEINRIPGVVENGFFTKIRPVVYISHRDGSLEVRP